MRYVDALVDLVFPRICPACSERITEPRRLVCVSCEKRIEPLRLPLCPACGCQDAKVTAGKCEDCPPGDHHFEAARAATTYADVAKTLVEKLKYSCREEYATHMVQHMLPVIAEQFSGCAFDVIVPVPLHSTRRRERGFNQAEVLATGLAGALHIPLPAASIRRARATPTQTRLSKHDRARNVSGAFALTRRGIAAGSNVLLVDDVYTTGATLNECAMILKAGGAASVRCITFARAALD